MWSLLAVNLLLTILCHLALSSVEDESSDVRDLGASLISQLKDDANLDLSPDEEYEDLRAELLAYHTTLAKLASASSRRSMRSTPCWQIGGICINYKLCTGYRYLTEVAGCRDNLNVCCFTWNRYKVSDFKNKGLNGLQFPWSVQIPYGQGKGLITKDELHDTLKKHRSKRPYSNPKPIKPNKESKKDKSESSNIDLSITVSIETDQTEGYKDLEPELLKSTKKVHFSADVKKKT